ncbi:MAG TPA: hypothetical protein VIY48_07035 [Candidatus Paceibacterota bacterium]
MARMKGNPFISTPERWIAADENKKGTLYRARVKFDRCIHYDGSDESKKAIIDLTSGGVTFEGDTLISSNGNREYDVGVIVCVNLTGEIDVWNKQTFDCLFEPWPETTQRDFYQK